MSVDRKIGYKGSSCRSRRGLGVNVHYVRLERSSWTGVVGAEQLCDSSCGVARIALRCVQVQERRRTCVGQVVSCGVEFLGHQEAARLQNFLTIASVLLY